MKKIVYDFVDINIKGYMNDTKVEGITDHLKISYPCNY